MKIFVSYTMRDGFLNASYLMLLEAKLTHFGLPYIDLIHNCSRDPQRRVIQRLNEASAVYTCLTPSIMKSPWVRFELALAFSRRIPVYTFDPFTLISAGCVPAPDKRQSDARGLRLCSSTRSMSSGAAELPNLLSLIGPPLLPLSN